MNRYSQNRGFTFIEIVFVLAIVLVLAAFIVPNITPLVESIQLRNTANSIKYKLILAKTRALGDSRINCGVFFDTASTPQSVFAFIDDEKSGNRGYFDPGIDPKYMEPFNLPPIISLKIGGAGINRSIVFRGDGTTAVHGMQLTVETKNGRKKSISVLPSTGRIRITTP